MKKEEMSPLLRATVEYCDRTKGNFVVYCNKCLLPAGYDDMTASGSWCSECSNELEFSSVPTDFTAEWEKAVAEGKKLPEIQSAMATLIAAA